MRHRRHLADGLTAEHHLGTGVETRCLVEVCVDRVAVVADGLRDAEEHKSQHNDTQDRRRPEDHQLTTDQRCGSHRRAPLWPTES